MSVENQSKSNMEEGRAGTNGFRYSASAAVLDFLDDERSSSSKTIVNIVKFTEPSSITQCTPDDLRKYRTINPAINENKVPKSMSGCLKKKVQNILKKSVVKEGCKVRVEYDLRKVKRSWTLPAHGDRSNPNCGHRKGAEACTERDVAKDRVLRGKYWSCNRSSCPDCMESWTAKMGRESFQKLIAGRQIYGKSKKSLCHVVISFPPEDTKFLSREKGRLLLQEDFLRVCRDMDMHGLFILHPWRGKKDVISDKDPDAVFNLPPEELASYWKEGVHVHCICYCDADFIRSHSSLYYAATGNRALVKVIADHMDEAYARNTISYALSHAGVGSAEGFNNTRAITWFGAFAPGSPNALRLLREVKEPASYTCSECSSRLYDTRDLDEGLDECCKPSSVVLKHRFYDTKDVHAGHTIMTEGMTDDEFRRYVLDNSDTIAYSPDPRDMEIPPNFNLLEWERLQRMKPPEYRWKPSVRLGQTMIDSLISVGVRGRGPRLAHGNSE